MSAMDIRSTFGASLKSWPTPTFQKTFLNAIRRCFASQSCFLCWAFSISKPKHENNSATQYLRNSRIPKKNGRLFRSTRDNAPAWAAMALHDPDRTITTMESFFEKPPEDSRRSTPAPWSVVANCTARQGDSLVDYICGELLSTWIPGMEK